MAQYQVQPYVGRILAEHGFNKKIIIPIKMITNLESTLNVALPRSVEGLVVVSNQSENFCEKMKGVISRVRPNSFVMCLFDDYHPAGMVSLFYK
ncbi:DUF4898 domain-containing protein [Metallosphaera tengchongensis]|uniref:DUF4898 domain-containing protein n=1 Tax=Metallosphaera tengchongensis TaxID=1532350 RepID=A0A6N0NR37_9CREN|nr:DUF4898 domain-containing protein [Metallosphaera tengchongensis]